MYLKPVKIYNKISDTLMKIYEFSWTYSNALKYSVYYESRRNNTEDIWGHEWQAQFYKTILKEEREFCEKHDYYADSYERNTLDEAYINIGKKYNPYLQRTESGEPYLIIKQIPLPVIDSSLDVTTLLRKQLYKFVDDANIIV